MLTVSWVFRASGLINIHLSVIAFHGSLILFLKYFMCVNVLPECVSVHHLHAWTLQRTEDSIRSPESEVTVSCEAPCWCWESNSGPWEEQQVFLTSETSFQPHPPLCIKFIICMKGKCMKRIEQGSRVFSSTGRCHVSHKVAQCHQKS